MQRTSQPPLLVVAESREDALLPLTLELLGLARKIADESGGSVAAVLIADDPARAQALIEHGADGVYVCHAAASSDYEGESWVAVLERLARDIAPVAVLLGHTPSGADLGPRLAARLQSCVATGCIGIVGDAGKLLFTRPCYGGNVRETISFTTLPAVATVKAGVGEVLADSSRKGFVVAVEPTDLKPRTRVVARERESSAAKRLEDSKIVVAGGRGLDGPDGFRVLKELADVMGAAVGSSRVPCDLGWCPHSWQIGLTGKTVTPDLYFAVGISGAGHHMAGCGNAKSIIAINTDPDAPIFKEARFGVVGDYRKIVPALTDAIAQLNALPQGRTAA